MVSVCGGGLHVVWGLRVCSVSLCFFPGEGRGWSRNMALGFGASLPEYVQLGHTQHGL